jgi:hypothetical protein
MRMPMGSQSPSLEKPAPASAYSPTKLGTFCWPSDHERQIRWLGHGLGIRMSANPKDFRGPPTNGVHVR